MALNRAIPLILVMFAPALAGEPAAIDLAQIDRSIVKEPPYVGRPHYALIVVGPRAEHRSWLVMDGDETLYFDRNGNGDLTDPEDRIRLDAEATGKMHMAEESTLSGMNAFDLGKVMGVSLRFDYWVRKRGFVPADERLRKFKQEREANDWENGTLWRLAAKGSHAQNPVLLAARPADAQILHLDGPLTFALKWGELQALQPWPKTTVFDVHIGTSALPPKNYNYRMFAPLTEFEIPRKVHPRAKFEFPPKSPGSAPVVSMVELDLRCCGDTVYAQMAVPREAAEGTAKVTLDYPGWTERVVHPATFEIRIGGPPQGNVEQLSFILFHDAGGSISLDDAMTALCRPGTGRPKGHQRGEFKLADLMARQAGLRRHAESRATSAFDFEGARRREPVRKGRWDVATRGSKSRLYQGSMKQRRFRPRSPLCTPPLWARPGEFSIRCATSSSLVQNNVGLSRFLHG